jgi:hypothetical protein
MATLLYLGSIVRTSLVSINMNNKQVKHIFFLFGDDTDHFFISLIL